MDLMRLERSNWLLTWRGGTVDSRARAAPVKKGWMKSRMSRDPLQRTKSNISALCIKATYL
jgi:hypothetical protein